VALLVAVAGSFGYARLGTVHAPGGELAGLGDLAGLEAPTDHYLDLGAGLVAQGSSEYTPAPAPWQREHSGARVAPEPGRYLDLGALEGLRSEN
jgi:hypothetical protein